MDGELHAELFGDADDMPEPDGDNEAPPAAEPSSALQATVLEAAHTLIKQWDASGASEPLELPSFLKTDHRAALHSFCEHRNLDHESKGDGGIDGDVRLVISRRRGGGGADGGGGDGDDEAGHLGELLTYACAMY